MTVAIMAREELTVCEHALQKYLPLDLRPKKTRAIRRQMTKYQVHFSHSCCLWGLGVEVTRVTDSFQTPLRALLHARGLLKSQLGVYLITVASRESGLVRVVLLLQVKARTEKQLKKDRAFPQRKFAIKA